MSKQLTSAQPATCCKNRLRESAREYPVDLVKDISNSRATIKKWRDSCYGRHAFQLVIGQVQKRQFGESTIELNKGAMRMGYLSDVKRGSTIGGLARATAVVTAGLLTNSAAHAGFVDFTIRGAPTISHPVPGETEFVISAGGQKAALGSNDINGRTLGSLQSVSITRLDDESRFTPGSGPAVAPYLNFWITDGAGHFAVVANEPSNADMQAFYNKGWDLSAADLANTIAKVFENNNAPWLPAKTRDTNGDLINDAWSFTDFFGFVIQAPSVADFSDPLWTGHGTGAPRELGTDVAYGVNWVFGDTLSNYTSGDPGYLVSNAAVSAANAVPEPSSMALVSLALLGLSVAGRRRRG